MIRVVGVALIVVSLFTISAIALGHDYNLGFGFDTPSQGPELNSPADRVESARISITNEGVLLRELENVRLVNLADTNSMDPVLDTEATAIEIVPSDASELQVGDIISFASSEKDTIIIHRIVSISSDGEWFAMTKGDNNVVSDNERVRFEQIKGVVVGIVY